jgi:hypothetical protein
MISVLKSKTYFNFAPGDIANELRGIPKIVKRIKKDNLMIKEFYETRI